MVPVAGSSEFPRHKSQSPGCPQLCPQTFSTSRDANPGKSKIWELPVQLWDKEIFPSRNFGAGERLWNVLGIPGIFFFSAALPRSRFSSLPIFFCLQIPIFSRSDSATSRGNSVFNHSQKNTGRNPEKSAPVLSPLRSQAQLQIHISSRFFFFCV